MDPRPLFPSSQRKAHQSPRPPPPPIQPANAPPQLQETKLTCSNQVGVAWKRILLASSHRPAVPFRGVGAVAFRSRRGGPRHLCGVSWGSVMSPTGNLGKHFPTDWSVSLISSAFLESASTFTAMWVTHGYLQILKSLVSFSKVNVFALERGVIVCVVWRWCHDGNYGWSLDDNYHTGYTLVYVGRQTGITFMLFLVFL